MLSYHVVERTSEIGIRMALGAQRRNVLLLIVSDGMKLAVIGTAIGLAVAIALAKIMSTMLFGIAPADAFTFAAVSTGSSRSRVTRLLHTRAARDKGGSAGCPAQRMNKDGLSRINSHHRQ